MNSLYLLLSLDPASLTLLFWFTLMFDLPRYVISIGVVAIFARKDLPAVSFTTSAIVAGHNEAGTIRACVESIDADQIIVVDWTAPFGMDRRNAFQLAICRARSSSNLIGLLYPSAEWRRLAL
jgi:hypothetical protein